LITENTNDLIIITNFDKTFRYVSPSVKLLGYTPDELVGQDSFFLLHPEDKISITSMLKQLVTGMYKPGTSSRFEYRLRDKSGVYHIYETAAKLVKDTSGKHGILSISRDITERKKAEENIKIFSDAIASAFDFFMLTDLKGNITYANESAISEYGYTSEEFLKLNIAELDTDQMVTKKVMQDIAVKERWSGEIITIKKNKEKFPAILSAFIIKDDKSNPIGMMGILRDITERKVAEEKIKKQIVQMQKLNKIKSSFLNITSHELHTPMSAIKGYIQMMLKGNLGTINEEQKHSLEVILRNSNRLDRLIQDVLDISRLESGTMKFILQKTDVKKMVTETVEIMQASADLKRIKINAEMGIDAPELTIDKDRITQVVVNLLNNAIKFSPDGSMIQIKAKKEKEDVLFEVQDYGRGIPEEHQKKIFQTFYQVDSDADTKFGGAGLGLAICYGIITAHGGRIWVESTGKPGEGSTFLFTLPVISIINIEERFKGADVFGLEKE
jgi:PAS domain S-box-containing protein